jgi:hypothetical protein
LAYLVVVPGFVLIHPWRKVWSVVEVAIYALVAAMLALIAVLPALGLIAAAELKALHAASPGILIATAGVCEYIVLTRLLPKPAPGTGDE